MHNKTVQGIVEYAKTYVTFGRCEAGTIGLRFCSGGVCSTTSGYGYLAGFFPFCGCLFPTKVSKTKV